MVDNNFVTKRKQSNCTQISSKKPKVKENKNLLLCYTTLKHTNAWKSKTRLNFPSLFTHPVTCSDLITLGSDNKEIRTNPNLCQALFQMKGVEGSSGQQMCGRAVFVISIYKKGNNSDKIQKNIHKSAEWRPP